MKLTAPCPCCALTHRLSFSCLLQKNSITLNVYSVFSEYEIADFLYASVLAKLTLYCSHLQKVFFFSP